MTSALTFLSKLQKDHIYLNSHSRMRVSLVAQVNKLNFAVAVFISQISLFGGGGRGWGEEAEQAEQNFDCEEFWVY